MLTTDHIIVDVSRLTHMWVTMCGKFVPVGQRLSPKAEKCTECAVLHETKQVLIAALTW